MWNKHFSPMKRTKGVFIHMEEDISMSVEGN